jgi:hypothetical protein
MDTQVCRSLGKEFKENKKFNHRGRRARRDKNNQRLKAKGAREKAVPFPALPGNLKLPRGVHGKISALSASSSFILWSSSAEDP